MHTSEFSPVAAGRPRARVVASILASVTAAVGVTLTGAHAASAATVTVVPAIDRSVAHSGHWTPRRASGAFGGEALVTDGRRKQGLVYYFTSPDVSVAYCSGPMDGKMSIYVDGKLRGNINSYSPFTACTRAFFVGGMTSGTRHRLVVQASAKRGAEHATSQIAINFIATS